MSQKRYILHKDSEGLRTRSMWLLQINQRVDTWVWWWTRQRALWVHRMGVKGISTSPDPTQKGARKTPKAHQRDTYKICPCPSSQQRSRSREWNRGMDADLLSHSVEGTIQCIPTSPLPIWCRYRTLTTLVKVSSGTKPRTSNTTKKSTANLPVSDRVNIPDPP